MVTHSNSGNMMSKLQKKNSLIKDTGITVTDSISVKEYSCMEESNSKFRAYMEDRYVCIDQFGGIPSQAYFGIFDGHGGKDASEHCSERMHEEFLKIISDEYFDGDIEGALDTLFTNIDNELRLLDADNSGTTACVVYIKSVGGFRKMYVANVGDTRAVLWSNGSAVRLTYDHRCTDNDEIERIQQMGGLVISNRVGGQLALTRSLGDHALRNNGVIAQPYIKVVDLTSEDKWLVIGTDGIWDFMSDEDTVELINETTEQTAEKISKDIIRASIKKGSKDNITCLVVKL